MMKALLVEDDGSTRRIIKSMLIKLGFSVTECENAEDGWEAYQREVHEIALFDWMLPGMTGIELCRQIRAMPQGDNTAIIMSTSQDQLSDVEIALKAGADDYIVKPIDITQLKIRIYIARQRIRSLKDQKQITDALQRKLKKMEQEKNGSAGEFFFLYPSGESLLVAVSGSFNNRGLKRLRSRVLKEIESKGKKKIILDLSLFSLEPGSTDGFEKLIKAIYLMGAESFLTGIKSDFVEHIVEYDSDLGLAKIVSSLSEAIILSKKNKD